MVICKYKFMMFGCCGVSVFDFVEIIWLILEKLLVCLLYGCGGCNVYGWIIIWYKGGGYKCVYWMIDFCCNDKDGVNVKVVYIEYDLNCIVWIVLFYYFDGEKCYIIVFNGFL